MKIGILTFHEVFNYGAVLQAYSLQKILEYQGHDCELINFCKKKQKDYTTMYSHRNGIKRSLKNLLLLPLHNKRRVRFERFEQFFNDNLKLSNEKYWNEEEIKKTIDMYDVFLIGSDQVWNVLKESDFSTSYFLDYVPSNKVKVAYAPSIGNSTYEDLLPYKHLLERFSLISCREKGGACILNRLVNKQVDVVLDPTLLVPEAFLREFIRDKNESKYLLYYSLDGYDKRDRNIDLLCYIADKYNLDIKFITPEWPFHKCIGEAIYDAGPREFLELLANANLVCTNSFHGTALSIKLGIPFFVLEDLESNDERKRSILEMLNIEERIISCIDDVNKYDDYHMDYSKVKILLDTLIKDSALFLDKAISMEN